MTPEHPSPKRLYAHFLSDSPEDQWQTLDAHLEACAEQTQNFAVAFNTDSWGEPTGR